MYAQGRYQSAHDCATAYEQREPKMILPQRIMIPVLYLDILGGVLAIWRVGWGRLFLREEMKRIGMQLNIGRRAEQMWGLMVLNKVFL